MRYIWEDSDWPRFYWSHEAILKILGDVRNRQGRLIGKMESLGFELRNEAVLETLTLDVLKSNEIEGASLNPEQVRSSVARRLGMDIQGLIPSDRDVDGVVEMMMDATQKFDNPISEDRLFGWHSSLFPSGRSGLYKIRVGKWRNDENGPMQVVFGAMGKENVYFQAPNFDVIEKEMLAFIEWFNNDNSMDAVMKAAVAHLWFVTIHPFEDGNGRIARALTDQLLARADNLSQRFYSMSAKIQNERSEYYRILEITQKGSLDITYWLKWFLNCLLSALSHADAVLEKVVKKHQFLNKHAASALNERQSKMVVKILEGFSGNVTTSKWAKICKCSNDTALRDIQDLMNKKILLKKIAGGRSTSYVLEGF